MIAVCLLKFCDVLISCNFFCFLLAFIVIFRKYFRKKSKVLMGSVLKCIAPQSRDNNIKVITSHSEDTLDT